MILSKAGLLQWLKYGSITSLRDKNVRNLPWRNQQTTSCLCKNFLDNMWHNLMFFCNYIKFLIITANFRIYLRFFYQGTCELYACLSYLLNNNVTNSQNIFLSTKLTFFSPLVRKEYRERGGARCTRTAPPNAWLHT